MKLIILKDLVENLGNDFYQNWFSRLVYERQQCFKNTFQLALCLDKYDLISKHFILINDKEEIVAYSRFINQSSCQKYNLQLPLVASLSTFPSLLKQVNDYLKLPKEAVQVNYLFKTKAFSSLFPQMEFTDFMMFLTLYFCETPFENLSMGVSINKKFKMIDKFLEMGPTYGNVETYKHPDIPDDHLLVLTSKFSKEYIETRKNKYLFVLNNLENTIPEKYKIPTAS